MNICSSYKKSIFLTSLVTLIFGPLSYRELCAKDIQIKSLCNHHHDTSDPVLKSFVLEVCELTNAERSSRSFIPLELDAQLNRLAQKYAEEMFRGNFFDHVSPTGSTFKSRLEEGKINYRSAGENIARGQDTPATVVRQWMQSPGHRQNLLKPVFRKIGVGTYKNYWVQVFTD